MMAWTSPGIEREVDAFENLLVLDAGVQIFDFEHGS